MALQYPLATECRCWLGCAFRVPALIGHQIVKPRRREEIVAEIALPNGDPDLGREASKVVKRPTLRRSGFFLLASTAVGGFHGGAPLVVLILAVPLLLRSGIFARRAAAQRREIATFL